MAEELKVFACAINERFQIINNCAISFFPQATSFDDSSFKFVKFRNSRNLMATRGLKIHVSHCQTLFIIMVSVAYSQDYFSSKKVVTVRILESF